MKQKISLLAVMMSLALGGAYAETKPVKMTFSGTNVATTINLQSGTVTDELQLAGKGSLGSFTFRELHADGGIDQPPAGCSGLFFGVLLGTGVFRFEDGSLLIIGLTDGTGCIDLSRGVASIVANYEVRGGTGRFAGASGHLTLKSTIAPVLFNESSAPALLTNTGTFEGWVFGVAGDDNKEH